MNTAAPRRLALGSIASAVGRRARLWLLVGVAAALAVVVALRTVRPLAKTAPRVPQQVLVPFFGRVVDARGDPVPSDTVTFQPAADAPRAAFGRYESWSAKTGPDGRFELRLPLTRLEASVQHRPFVEPASAHFDLAASPQRSIALVVLSRDQWPPITGYVVDDRGLRLPDAVISGYADFMAMPEARTDDHGAFTVERDVDDSESWVELRVSHPQWDEAARWAEWGSEVQIALRPRAPAEVRVVDAEGQPFTAVRVEHRWSPMQEQAEWVRDGAVLRGGLCHGRNTVAVHLQPENDEWFEPSPLVLHVVDGAPVTATVVVRRAATRRVRVLDASGDPVESAKVELVDARGTEPAADVHFGGRDTDSEGPIEVAKTKTGRNGEAMLRGPAGQSMLVRVYADGLVPVLVAAVDVAESEPLVVKLAPAARLRGHLVLGAEAPPGPWAVEAHSASGDAADGTGSGRPVGDLGVFEVTDVPPGTWNLCLSNKDLFEGAVASVELVAGDNKVSIDASRWAWTKVRGRIRVDGVPWSGSGVVLERVDPGRPSLLRSQAGLRVDRGGRFQATLRPGRYRLRVPLDAFNFSVAGPTVDVDEQVDAPIEVDWNVTTGVLELELVDERGEPARGMRLFVLEDVFDFYAIAAAADGAGMLRVRRPPGDWSPVWLSQREAAPASWSGRFVEAWLGARRPLAPVTVRAGETTRARVVLPDAAFVR